MKLPTSILFESADFPLEAGGRLDPLVLAYETWGTLSKTADNAILLCHGYTSTPHAAGDETGWWDGLIGPGKAIDTDKYFVVCSNMIGSSFGSSGPPSINPASGAPFGPDFPEFSTNDMVSAQRRLIDHLGIRQLAAVIGYSYGGYLTFLWGAQHPELMRALVVVASGIKGRGDQSMTAQLRDRFAPCAGWNRGHYYNADPTESVRAMLKTIRMETLTGYGVGARLQAQLGDDAAASAKLEDMAEEWAAGFDANSLIELRRAAVAYDGRPGAAKIKAPLLYVLARTDALFPPDLADPTIALLREAGVSAAYFEIDSDFGHHAPAADWALWAPALQGFLEENAA